MHTLCYYKEYDFGHLGFLIPANKRIFFDMLELAKIYVENLENMQLGPTVNELIEKTNISLTEVRQETNQIIDMIRSPEAH
jgi:hypothetical protein